MGASGSGKTTLLKILLKFYDLPTGIISIGDQDLTNISQKAWRQRCGTVMQEGFIFGDTVAGNIAIGEDIVDRERVKRAVEIANIRGFVESLPLAYNTKIGQEGVGMSTGQKQRLLIARAIYKDPSIILFDEATSALDANNEKQIVENLKNYFEGKTVVVIAHRLSTIRNANQIIVLEKGKVSERGTHDELIAARGAYFNLVKNQLDMESIS